MELSTWYYNKIANSLSTTRLSQDHSSVADSLSGVGLALKLLQIC